MNSYKNFIPFCKDSKIYDIQENTAKGSLKLDLPMGFSQTIESDILFERPYKIVSVTESPVFKYLESTWNFHRENDSEEFCTIEYQVLLFWHLVHSTVMLSGIRYHFLTKCLSYVPDIIVGTFLENQRKMRKFEWNSQKIILYIFLKK